jgi:hypothetical protein
MNIFEQTTEWLIGTGGGEYGDRVAICAKPDKAICDLWRRDGFKLAFYEPDRARQVFKELTGKWPGERY